MALSFDVQKTHVIQGAQNTMFGVVDVTLDDAYPDGGWAIGASDLGVETILVIVPQAISAGGTVFFYNAATGKLLAYEQDGAAGALVACTSADDLNDGDIVRCFFVAV